MRRNKKITAAAMFMAVIMTIMGMQAAVPVYGADASSYAPYAKVEYGYTDSVTCGTLRYISQSTSSANYHAEYWTKADGSVFSASGECLTSCISMALSYVGANIKPVDILSYSTSTVWRKNWGGITGYAEDTFETTMNNYLSGAGKYSPPIIHLEVNPTFYPSGHYVLVVGKISDTQYQVLDPSDGGNPALREVTIADGFVSCELWGKGTYTSMLSTGYQYYNEPAAITNQPVVDTPSALASIEAITYPETLVEGSSFLLKGKISSETNIKKVTASIVYAAGGTVLSTSAEPNAKTYDLSGAIDSKMAFGSLAPGKYIYIVTAINDGGEATLIYAEFTIIPGPTKITEVANVAKGIEVCWQETGSADGYIVYRKETGTDYEAVFEVDDPQTISYVDEEADTNYRKYTYKLSVIVRDGNDVLESSLSDKITTYRVPAPKSLAVKKTGYGRIKVSHKKVSKATSYQVQYSTSKNFKSAKTLAFTAKSNTISGLTAGKKYYVRVRTGYKKNGIIYRSAWTKVKGVKL